MWVINTNYSILPSIDKDGLALNVGTDDNALSFELAKTVGEFFQFSNQQMPSIINKLLTATKQWRKLADKIGISRAEHEIMSKAFANTG